MRKSIAFEEPEPTIKVRGVNLCIIIFFLFNDKKYIYTNMGIKKECNECIIQKLREPWYLQQPDKLHYLNARPCDDREPRKHMIEERRREKLKQHFIQAIIAPYSCSCMVDRREASYL